VDETLAGAVSMWVGEGSPMIAQLSTSTLMQPGSVAIARTAGQLANTLCSTVGGKDTDVDFAQHCLRAMIVAMVYADRVLPEGVFARSSGVNIKRCVHAIRRHAGDSVDMMLNNLKYTTTHYNTASGSIQNLIEG